MLREQRAAYRKRLRTELVHEQSIVSRILSVQPATQPLKRLHHDELAIARQQRATAPDTWGWATLLRVQRSYVALFTKEPGNLARCKSAYEDVLEIVVKGIIRPEGRVDVGSGLDYFIAKRVTRAMRLASSLILEAGGLHDAERLHRSALELAAVLGLNDVHEDADAGVTLFLPQPNTLAAAEVQFRMCQSAGYRPLPGADLNGARFAAHPDGGIMAVWPEGIRYDVDVSLLSDDEGRFPDPTQTATALLEKGQHPSFMYVDRRGEARELRYQGEAVGHELR